MPEQDQEQELTDLLIDRNDIRLNKTNDIALVDGIENVKQSVALDVRDITHFAIGSNINANTIYDVTAAIERSLAADPQITAPTTVELQSINKDANELQFDITTRDNEGFTLDLVLPE